MRRLGVMLLLSPLLTACGLFSESEPAAAADRYQAPLDACALLDAQTVTDLSRGLPDRPSSPRASDPQPPEDQVMECAREFLRDKPDEPQATLAPHHRSITLTLNRMVPKDGRSGADRTPALFEARRPSADARPLAEGDLGRDAGSRFTAGFLVEQPGYARVVAFQSNVIVFAEYLGLDMESAQQRMPTEEASAGALRMIKDAAAALPPQQSG